MKKKTFAILALLALMFGVLTGCTVDPDQAVPTKYVERVNVTPEAKASVGEQRARQAVMTMRCVSRARMKSRSISCATACSGSKLW